MGSKIKLDYTFKKEVLLGTEDLVMISFSGNHWDDIAYFPKLYQIGLVQKGAGKISSGEKEYLLKTGDFYFVYPGLVHKGKPDPTTGWTVTEIQISPAFIQQFLGDEPDTFFNELQISNHLLQQKFTLLVDELEMKPTRSEISHSINDFLFECSQTIVSDKKIPPSHRAVGKAKQYIEENFKENFSLEDLANHAALSKFHLLRIFKKETGLAPYTYQLQLRLNAARKLIFQKKHLSEVAHELGFVDQAHFIHTYKKYAAITPGDFLNTAIFYNSKD
ncbi:MAG: AraC family transcriptional regulator [Cyclobacteriaceae bacterium]